MSHEHFKELNSSLKKKKRVQRSIVILNLLKDKSIGIASLMEVSSKSILNIYLY